MINVDHFATVTFMRADPILPLGLAAMVLQALVMSFTLSRHKPEGASLRDGVLVSVAFGLFLAAYIVLVEPSKYAVPSITTWMTVESAASSVQFILFGFLLGWIHRSRMGDSAKL